MRAATAKARWRQIA